MKYKKLIPAATVFFLLINTSYFWEGKLGAFAFPVFIGLMIFFFVLVILWLIHTSKCMQEKCKSKSRIGVIAVLSIVLITTAIKPYGLVNYDRLYGKNLLIAQREGSAHCTVTLTLKENGTFRERHVCFGVREIRGSYEIRNDTVFFKMPKNARNPKFSYAFALIMPSRNPHYREELVLYRHNNDTPALVLWILSNQLPVQSRP